IRRRRPSRVVLVYDRGQERVYALGPNVLPPAVTPAVIEQVDQHAQIRGCRKESRVPRNAAVGVERITVVDLAVEDVLSPPIPCGRVAAIAVAKSRIVHHVLLVYVALFRCRELGEAVGPGIECSRAKPEWSIKILVDE